MKVTCPEQHLTRIRGKLLFRELLAPMRKVAPRPTGLPPVERSGSTGELRVLARGRMHAEAARLEGRAAEFETVREERVDARLLDLICRELSIVLDPPVGGAHPDSRRPLAAAEPRAPAASPVSTEDRQGGRSAAVIALIEKIDYFVRSQRPALALTLGGGSRVEIERTGPREVALKIKDRHGPPAAEDLGRIREEIRARGLRLAALSVG